MTEYEVSEISGAYANRIKRLEQENTELKKQIEKMKRCYNCKHWQNESWYGVCQLEQIDCSDYKCWELKE